MFALFAFSIQEFFICYFYCQKTAFVCEFQHTPLCKMTFFSRFHTSCGYEILLTCTLLTQEQEFEVPQSIPILKNGFFGPQNSVVSLEHKKKLFFPTLNLMVLQTVWNECVRFGGHINIQVNYKILQFEVQKKTSILHNLPCFQEGLF
jgi:hypothetical protein